MIEAGEVIDGETLEAWLKQVAEERGVEEGRRIAALIAHRAAMRAAPIHWRSVAKSGFASQSEGANLPVFWSLLSSAAAAIWPKLETKSAAYASADAVAGASEFFGAAAAAAVSAAYAAAFSADPAEDATVAAISASVAWDDDVALWREVSMDCAKEKVDDLLRAPIWRVEAYANAAAAEARSTLSGQDWRFWLAWYEAALNGRLYNDANRILLTRIALIGRNVETGELIAEEEWDKGPEHIAALIDELRVEQAIAVTPNAEEVVFDEVTRVFHVEPVVTLAADAHGYAVKKLRAALALIDGFAGGNDPYGGLGSERDLLRDGLADPGALPKSLFDLSRKIARRVRSRAAAGECPEPNLDANLADFLFELEETALDLLADEEVRKLDVHRSKIRMNEAQPLAPEIVAEAFEAMRPALDAKLTTEMKADAAIIADPTAAPEDDLEAKYRSGSRLLRIYRRANQIAGSVSAGSENFAGAFKNIGVIVGSTGAVGMVIQYFVRLVIGF